MDQNIKTNARKLRQQMTDAEIKLWRLLRNKKFYGYKFRRQYWIESYIVDFICIERKIIIELDGGQHLLQKVYDDIRTKCLEVLGFKVIRFWNDDVFKNTEAMLEMVHDVITGIDPPSSVLRTPSPASGRRENQ